VTIALLITTLALLPALTAIAWAAPDALKTQAEQAKRNRPRSRPSKRKEDAKKKTGKRAKKTDPAKTENEKESDGTKDGTINVAHIRLAGAVLTREPDFDFLRPEQGGNYTLKQWLERLAEARKDENIDAVALVVDDLRCNWAQAQELADAIRRFQLVGKPVHVHLTDATPPRYLVASAGRHLTMEPRGGVTITGVSIEAMFFKGTLDKLGMTAQLVQAGKYKGASEPLTRTRPSKELAHEYNKLLDELYDQLVDQIASQRALMRKAVVKAIDRAPMFGTDAVKHGLADQAVSSVHWRESLEDRLATDGATVRWHWDYAKPTGPKMDFSNPFQMLSVMMGAKKDDRTKDPTIAILHIDGVIAQGKNGNSMWFGRTTGSATITRIVGELTANDSIKALIVRIQSPGGSALASEKMLQALRRCAEKKPVIASVSGMAASGGYYVACGTDHIIADKAAIVGSIGVVGGKIAMEEFLNEKLGITTWQASRGKNAALWDSDKWTRRELRVVRRLTNTWYETFTKRVRQGRRGREIDIEKVAQGRIFTARQAVDNGLVDELGGLKEAVAVAQKRAKIEKSYFKVYPRPRTMADVLTGGSTAGAGATNVPLRWLLSTVRRSDGAAYLLTLGQLMQDESVLLAMPHYLTVRR
jgi:protease-4